MTVQEPKKIKLLIPFKEFEKIHNGLKKNSICYEKRCPFSITTCHARDCLEKINEWWQKTNGDLPGLSYYKIVFDAAICHENEFYWKFWTEKMRPCHECYDEMIRQIKIVFGGGEADARRLFPDWI